jgi:hypothetical protein
VRKSRGDQGNRAKATGRGSDTTQRIGLLLV